MKTLFTFLAFAIGISVSAQKYDNEVKINRKVRVVFKGDLLGMTVKKKLVLPIEYTDYLPWPSGLTILKDTLAGFVDFTGKVVLPFEFMDIVEDNYFGVLTVLNYKNETAVFDKSGKMLVPFNLYEPSFLDRGIIVYSGNNSAMYDYHGNIIIPNGEYQLNPLDDRGDFVSVSKSNGESVMWLNDEYEYPTGYSGINEHIFAKQTEVSIEDYFLFLADQKYNGYMTDPKTGEMISVKSLLPDTNFVEAKLLPLYRHVYRELAIEEGEESSKGKLLLNDYAYSINLPYKLNKEEVQMSKFPVTGVTTTQADWYADWLSLMHLEWTMTEYRPEFSLPSEKEWISLAEDGLRPDMKANHMLDSLNEQNCMLFIFENLPNCKGYEGYLKASLGSGTVPVTNMNADLNGLRNTFGNVSEMTQVEGLAKGGNYTLPASEANTQKQQLYTGPQPWLGFRLVGRFRL